MRGVSILRTKKLRYISRKVTYIRITGPDQNTNTSRTVASAIEWEAEMYPKPL